MDVKILIAVVAFCFCINSALGQGCKDKLSHCESWPDKYCQDYLDYMKENCPKKCGYCTGPTVAPACKDLQPVVDCLRWKGQGYCDKSSVYYNYLKKNCQKSCGFCGTTPATTKPPNTKPTRPTQPTQPSGSCSASQKLQGCSFDSDTCDFIDVPFDDNSDFELIASGGQDNKGYLTARGRGEARLIYPLELLVPHNGDHGSMCMEFYYRISSGGSLAIHEVQNSKNYPKRTKFNVSGRQSSWKKERLTFRAAQFNHLLIQASANSGSVDIDNVRFCDNFCN